MGIVVIDVVVDIDDDMAGGGVDDGHDCVGYIISICVVGVGHGDDGVGINVVDGVVVTVYRNNDVGGVVVAGVIVVVVVLDMVFIMMTLMMLLLACMIVLLVDGVTYAAGMVSLVSLLLSSMCALLKVL